MTAILDRPDKPFCPNCGLLLEPTFDTCNECGQELSVCKHCRAPVKGEGLDVQLVNNCPGCGKPF